MGFLTITVAPDLTPAAHRRAVRAGPSSVAMRTDTASLLGQAGFTAVTDTDVTGEYLHTATSWLQAREQHRAELRPVAPVRFDEQQRDSRAAVAAIREGLLRRSLLTAVRPG